MDLPEFRYHPDPVGTESMEASDAGCLVCGQKRGYIYVGPVYAVADLDDSICPWCISSGEASAKYDAEFTDAAAIGDYGNWDQVPGSVVVEVSRRTPGFTGWQQERWRTCCDDACAFLGRAGKKELEEIWPEALSSISAECGPEGEELDEYLDAMDKDLSPTAYIFKCLHCGRLLGYSDCD